MQHEQDGVALIRHVFHEVTSSPDSEDSEKEHPTLCSLR